jgi:S1-C subfamily serine protease
MKTLKYVVVFALSLLVGFEVGGFLLTATAKKHRPSPPIVRYHDFKLNQAAIARATAYTVLISNEGFGGVGRGTGVLLDEKHILTCAHMVESQEDDIWIFPYPIRRVVKAHPVYGSRRADLAILELESAVSADAYAVFNSSPSIGQPITIIGNTLGSMQWFTSYGVISGKKAIFLLTDGLVRGGNSGGPWINDNGEILALTDWSLGDRNGKDLGISGGISAETIQKFLKEWQEPSLIQILLGSTK